MKLNNLPKVVTQRKKDLGRGIGSGRGKTSGRGTKGQKARGKIPAAQVGGGLIYYKKLPLRRGWGNTKVSGKSKVITLSQLNNLKPKTVVNLESLILNGLISSKEKGIKILSKGELKVALTVELPVSQSARKAIEQAGGQVVG